MDHVHESPEPGRIFPLGEHRSDKGKHVEAHAAGEKIPYPAHIPPHADFRLAQRAWTTGRNLRGQ